MNEHTKYPYLTKFTVNPHIVFKDEMQASINRDIELYELKNDFNVNRVTEEIQKELNKNTNEFIKNLCARYGIIGYEEIIKRVKLTKTECVGLMGRDENFDMYIDNKYVLTVRRVGEMYYDQSQMKYKLEINLKIVD